MKDENDGILVTFLITVTECLLKANYSWFIDQEGIQSIMMGRHKPAVPIVSAVKKQR